MAEPPSRRGLMALSPELHRRIAQFSDANSRIMFASCSKQCRQLWSGSVFRRVRIYGTQTTLASALRLYVSDNRALPVHDVRKNVRSLKVIILPAPRQPTIDLINNNQLLTNEQAQVVEDPELPALIFQALTSSTSATVLELDIIELRVQRAMEFRQRLQSAQAHLLPKAQHLKLKAIPAVTSMAIFKCSTLNNLVSLHLFAANENLHWQTASGFHQGSLRRLHLVINTNVDVVNLPSQDIGRINPTMCPALLGEIFTSFPRLEALVLAPSCQDSPRPFTTRTEGQFLERAVRRLFEALDRDEHRSLKRFAFALPAAQIGDAIYHNIYNRPPPVAAQDKIDEWFDKLAKIILGRVAHLQQLAIITRANEIHICTRGEGEMNTVRESTTANRRLTCFPFEILE